MKTILAILAGSVALAATLSHGMDEAPAATPTPAGATFLLMSGDGECTLEPTGGDLRAVRLEGGCLDHAPVGSTVAFIDRKADGSIDLVRRDGAAIVKFAAAEGETHVSYEPQSPLIRLVALD